MARRENRFEAIARNIIRIIRAACERKRGSYKRLLFVYDVPCFNVIYYVTCITQTRSGYMFDLDEILEESFQEDVSGLVCEHHNESPTIVYDAGTPEVQISGCCDELINRAYCLLQSDKT